ncbi:MAG: hypothetical protein D6744_03270 [Planctomycetota bacterium]|nr:MAG: hypothetical protein D6744_03270 [Planctomycetota bacterium]
MFPAVAAWMLPRDYALVVEPAGAGVHDWVTRRACLVIRVRGRRATIVGGNLIEVLLAAERPSETAP